MDLSIEYHINDVVSHHVIPLVKMKLFVVTLVIKFIFWLRFPKHILIS